MIEDPVIEDPKEDEIANWRDAWQQPEAGAPPADDNLAARVGAIRKSSRRFGIGLLVLTISELVVCLGVLGLGLYWVLARPTPFRILLLTLATFFVVVAEVFVLRNRRGTYRPRNQTTQAFIELEWLRLERQLRTIRFFIPFVVFELVTIGGLRLWEFAGDPTRLPQLVHNLLLSTLGLTLLIGPATWWWHRQIHRKMRDLAPLREAFAPPAGDKS